MRRPGHSTIAAYLALFFAMTATAWAAATIGSGDVVNNSLKSVDLKNNGGAKSPDVVNGTLGGGDVAANSLRSGDFSADAIGGSDIDESTLGVLRVSHALGGPINQQLPNSLVFRQIPNNSFTQQPTESDQIFGAAQVTFPAACTQPRSAFIYLFLDDPTFNPVAAIGIGQVTDSGVGAVTRRLAFNPAPFGTAGMALFRTGTAVNRRIYAHGAAGCNSGGGVSLDSINLSVAGQR